MPMNSESSGHAIDEKEMPMSAEPTQSNRRKGRGTAKAKQKDAPAREKVTLLISRDTNVKLSTMAALKGIDRSRAADAILSDALRHVVIALRGPLGADGTVGSGGGEGDPPAASPPAAASEEAQAEAREAA